MASSYLNTNLVCQQHFAARQYVSSYASINWNSLQMTYRMYYKHVAYLDYEFSNAASWKKRKRITLKMNQFTLKVGSLQYFILRKAFMAFRTFELAVVSNTFIIIISRFSSFIWHNTYCRMYRLCLRF